MSMLHRLWQGNAFRVGLAVALALAGLIGLAGLDGVARAGDVGVRETGRAGAIRLVPSTAAVMEGGSVTVDVLLEDAGDYYGLDLRLAFDQSLVSISGEQATPHWEAFDAADHLIVRNLVDIHEGRGRLWYVVTNLNPAQPFTGTGRICSITFTGLAAGSTPLELVYVKGSTRTGEALLPERTAGALDVLVPAWRGHLPLAQLNRR